MAEDLREGRWRLYFFLRLPPDLGVISSLNCFSLLYIISSKVELSIDCLTFCFTTYDTTFKICSSFNPRNKILCLS